MRCSKVQRGSQACFSIASSSTLVPACRSPPLLACTQRPSASQSYSPPTHAAPPLPHLQDDLVRLHGIALHLKRHVAAHAALRHASSKAWGGEGDKGLGAA